MQSAVNCVGPDSASERQALVDYPDWPHLEVAAVAAEVADQTVLLFKSVQACCPSMRNLDDSDKRVVFHHKGTWVRHLCSWSRSH